MKPYPRNARIHSKEQIALIADSIRQFGFTAPLLVDEDGVLIYGHGRHAAARLLKLDEVPVCVAEGWTEQEKAAYRIQDNQLALRSDWDLPILHSELKELSLGDYPLPKLGFTDAQITDLGLVVPEGESLSAAVVPTVTLAERFGAVPFSVLNAREGWWQGRKREWLALGMQPETGRDEVLFDSQARLNEIMGSETAATGTSIFDPVLCELAYRWFCPPGGKVWNPFMGESSPGIVASRLGLDYYAMDIRKEQAEANYAQSEIICQGYPQPHWMIGDSATGAVPPGLDFIFSCPPYADLEVYSNDPHDLSTMSYPAFLDAYRHIIRHACSELLPNRFACFVVGEVRDPEGHYRGFVPDTIKAFTDCGMAFYNEAILVTAVGSLPIRTGRQFQASRKLGKTHQNVLVFLKGDARKAAKAIGNVEFGEPAGDDSPAVALPQPVVTRWKVSAAWATKQHDCTLAGIHARCNGACCYGPTYWPGKSGGEGRAACPKLGPKGCTYTPEEKPVTCLLYPFTLNKSGTLVLHQRATTAKGICKGNFGQGPLLIEALRDNLVTLFGVEQYYRVRDAVITGQDSYFEPSDDVLAAYARDQEQAEANTPPLPRNGY